MSCHWHLKMETLVKNRKLTPSKVFIHVHVFRFLLKPQLHQCNLVCTACSSFTQANLYTTLHNFTQSLHNTTLHFVLCRNIPTSEKVELYKSWLVKQEAWIGITKKKGKVNFPPGTPVCGNSFSCNNLFHSKAIQLKWGPVCVQDDTVLLLGGRRP